VGRHKKVIQTQNSGQEIRLFGSATVQIM